LNKQLLEQIVSLSDTMKEIGLVHEKVSTEYQRLNEVGAAEMHRVLKDFFINFSDIKNLKDQIQCHLITPFNYKPKEITALNILLKEWYASRTQANLLTQKLKAKKAELYKKKAIDQWELKGECTYTPQDLFNSKTLAFKVMLPEESKEVKKHKDIYGYYSNKVHEEFLRLSANHCNKVSDDIRELMQKMKEGLVRVRVYR